jgi:hypothetical protein
MGMGSQVGKRAISRPFSPRFFLKSWTGCQADAQRFYKHPFKLVDYERCYRY